MARLPRIAILSAVALFTWSGFAGAQSPGPNPPPAAGARAAAPASPCLTISPQSLYFGEQRLGTESPPQAVTLTNQSNSKVDLGLSVSGDFELMTPPAAPLAAGKSTAAVVRFKPGREGTAPGVLTLTVRSGCTGGQMVRLWGITPGWLGVICSNARLADILLAAALCLLYWLAMVVVRWNRVAMPSRFVLRGQIASVKAELKTLQQAAPPPPPPTHAADLLGAAQSVIDGSRAVSGNRLRADRESAPRVRSRPARARRRPPVPCAGERREDDASRAIAAAQPTARSARPGPIGHL
ncbi:MAG TPA: choice-of-anchor D domain-containing protein [Thermoanaerobaculia bacterium]|nr:choice-of-anchor D domain-containing protein [Thermoanaerobaculia bacterium]